ncbi:MAG TPA: hypothetical protein P5534_07935, partial [Candidatus Paceibacterota bacterium]|nr:hypothetical protein [Candidatus Paceibacterota bacterium]
MGCIALAVAVTGPASGDELTPKNLIAARKIYVAKCAKCHRFYEPKDYSGADWQMWMEKMNKKSKLKPEQAMLLNRYLDAYRAGQLSSKPEDAR